jgi:hypothetical protein
LIKLLVGEVIGLRCGHYQKRLYREKKETNLRLHMLKFESKTIRDTATCFFVAIFSIYLHLSQHKPVKDVAPDLVAIHHLRRRRCCFSYLILLQVLYSSTSSSCHPLGDCGLLMTPLLVVVVATVWPMMMVVVLVVVDDDDAADAEIIASLGLVLEGGLAVDTSYRPW